MSRELKKVKGITDNFSYVDKHRHVPKAQGGTYDDPDNYEVIAPKTHMREHGIKRERPEWMQYLKDAIDEREQHLKTRIKVNNQILAFERETDEGSKETIEVLKSILGKLEELEIKAKKKIEDRLFEVKHNYPLIDYALAVKGLGPITIAYLVCYIDLSKASYVSSLWKYIGYDKPSHARYTKGTSGGGNQKLRTMLYRTADSMIKTRSPYRDIYDRRKAKMSTNTNMTKSRNTQGKLIDCQWDEAKPSHRHGDAIRVMMKHLLCHYWIVGRTLLNLPVSEPYVKEHLGHTHIVTPEMCGWSSVKEIERLRNQKEEETHTSQAEETYYI